MLACFEEELMGRTSHLISIFYSGRLPTLFQGITQLYGSVLVMQMLLRPMPFV